MEQILGIARQKLSNNPLGSFVRMLTSVRYDLDELEKSLGAEATSANWEQLEEIQNRARELFEATQELLGSLAIRKLRLDRGISTHAENLAAHYSERAGIDWRPTAIFAVRAQIEAREDVSAGDSPNDILLRIPFPRWGIWELPLIGYDLGYWIAKQERIKDLNLLSGAFPAIQLAELRKRIADSAAVYLAGPAYAYALLFLQLDPQKKEDQVRAALALSILEHMDEPPSKFEDGPYTAARKMLSDVWEGAVRLCTGRDDHADAMEQVRVLSAKIYEALRRNFQAKDGDAWNTAFGKLGRILREGVTEPLKVEVHEVIDAAWRLRALHCDNIADLTADSQRLVEGKYAAQGMGHGANAGREPAERLLMSRLFDLETDNQRFIELLQADEIDAADRDAVTGCLYRLLSDQDYGLKKLKKYATKDTLAGALIQVIQRGRDQAPIQQEILDFLGGVSVRSEKVDNGIGVIADKLLEDYARWTGVHWSSRTILGKNPLFSSASEIIHLRFPDWDIWSLSLMAHEFGHITALATQAFSKLLSEEPTFDAANHPEVKKWDRDKDKDRIDQYIENRRMQLHEFFADAFGVYLQGPAFAYCVVLLQFNPQEAFRQWPLHPSHAERVEAILCVLDKMNRADLRDKFDVGDFAPVLNRLKDLWQPELSAAGVHSTEETQQFLRLRARTLAGRIYELLERFYRLGSEYRAEDWRRALIKADNLLGPDQTDWTKESHRDLLNIGWAARIQFPDRVIEIGRKVRQILVNRATE